MRVPIRIKISGGVDGSLTPGTTWRVDRVTTHYEPSGIIGEDPPEFTLIDFAPFRAVPAAPGLDDDTLDAFARSVSGGCEIAGSHYVYPVRAGGIRRALQKHGLTLASLSPVQEEAPDG